MFVKYDLNYGISCLRWSWEAWYGCFKFSDLERFNWLEGYGEIFFTFLETFWACGSWKFQLAIGIWRNFHWASRNLDFYCYRVASMWEYVLILFQQLIFDCSIWFTLLHFLVLIANFHLLICHKMRKKEQKVSFK